MLNIIVLVDINADIFEIFFEWSVKLQEGRYILDTPATDVGLDIPRHQITPLPHTRQI